MITIIIFFKKTEEIKVPSLNLITQHQLVNYEHARFSIQIYLLIYSVFFLKKIKFLPSFDEFFSFFQLLILDFEFVVPKIILLNQHYFKRYQ